MTGHAPDPMTEIDLADPLTHIGDGALPLFQRLRREQPVAWHPPRGARRGFWSVTRYADVVAVCRDADTFGSTGGNVMDTLLHSGDSAAGRMLAVSDGPRHAGVRRLLWQGLTPNRLAAVSDRIRARSRALIHRARRAGGGDFARDVAAHIPLQGICDLLGVPERDRPFILEHTSSALSSVRLAAGDAAARNAKGQLLLYFAKLAGTRLGRPPEGEYPDLITLMVNGDIDGEPISLDEVVLNCYSLIMGGDETARLAMIGGVQAMIQHPDQWRSWRDGLPVEPAVQEILRWTTPAIHVGRTAMVPTTLAGQVIDAGDAVVAWLNSANNDETEFPEPGRFDLTRSPNRHLSFLYGSHFCIGAHLARVEIGSLFEALREEVTTLTRTGPPVPIYSSFLHGFSSLPVRLA
ncbi:cytochrome P450 [Krasilnikovia sp. MM14-A1004]|uniref:cytochrome P450 n=1 Tax=Krasilnikovia sp. MM14-A1004 TaxID=3373541 RepID=UPI00399D130A